MSWIWKFIKDYSKIALSLTRLTQKDLPFEWTPAADQAFQNLKKAFTTAPILAHVDPEKQFFVEADASDFAIESILSQIEDDGQLHPVAFHSGKFIPAEINYG